MQFEDHFKEPTTTVSIPGMRILADGSRQEMQDTVVCEHLLEVSVNGYTAMRLSCTADHLKELVVGRLFTEGLINGTADVEKLFFCGKGTIAEVTLAEGKDFTPYQGTEPTCCTGNRQLLTGNRKMGKLPETEINPAAVFALAAHFQTDTKLHRSTSGTHSCYLYLPDGAIVSFEDISRHNALDKAVGHMLLTGADPQACMLFTTGRVPADMVQKAVMAQVPVLISKSVPTEEALILAKEYGLALICKAWPDSYTVY